MERRREGGHRECGGNDTALATAISQYYSASYGRFRVRKWLCLALVPSGMGWLANGFVFELVPC
jgi:hypothetical protein